MVAMVALMMAAGAFALLLAPEPAEVAAQRPMPTSPRPETPPGSGAPAEAPPGAGSGAQAATPPPAVVATDPAGTAGSPPAGTPAAAQDTPEAVAERYFTAWRAGDFAAMAGLVADPPADFADRHRRFSADLGVTSLTLTPGAMARPAADAAEVPFHGVREVTGIGAWEFDSALRLTPAGGGWRVRWSPETLHPALKDGGSLRLRRTEERRPANLTREGKPFPADSRAGDYFTGLDGRTTRLALEEQPSGKVLLSSPEPPAGTRTTIAARVQAAAAKAVDAAGRPAAIVALDTGSGQIRAVADTLGGRRAFNGLYPPGSSFKVVTAAALLGAGLGPDAQVGCPASYTLPNGRTFTNDGGADRGTVSLTMAFAHSCNTTFARQAYERLAGDRLRAEAADRFGFREKPGLAYCRIRPATTPDELGSDAIGQNSVQASPLCMAEVAAAVASGTWRPATLAETPPAGSVPPVPLDGGVAAALRDMMRAVVTGGTAAQAGLPDGTAGKTGTAEVSGAASHAWFIGYRKSLAFAVFVQNGGSGPKVAAPIAARFLRAL
ncbi:hypothetical protein Sru01_03720 [Sphaerisporangium rufum]|uniref:Cell division protein FtsI n=2 Tax=Sphaerisporangium rufum TaxID=1381558 RepID=A0A919V2K8_9ACTN|nr:hypothetical protein Sru01_03720 [Sphaerisporangium rufum]